MPQRQGSLWPQRAERPAVVHNVELRDVEFREERQYHWNGDGAAHRCRGRTVPWVLEREAVDLEAAQVDQRLHGDSNGSQQSETAEQHIPCCPQQPRASQGPCAVPLACSGVLLHLRRALLQRILPLCLHIEISSLRDDAHPLHVGGGRPGTPHAGPERRDHPNGSFTGRNRPKSPIDGKEVCARFLRNPRSFD
eukprot:scaffold24806_cov129-Isochrysis_galbana.AAC.4